MIDTVKTDQEVVQEHDHLQMMQRPHLWPNRGILPLRKQGWTLDSPEDWLGVIYFHAGHEDSLHRWTVYTGTFCIFGDKSHPIYYNSPEAIIADGWEVD